MKRTALFLAMLLAFAFSGVCLAGQKHSGKGDLVKKEKSLEDVRRQIRDEKKNIKKITEKETSVLSELERINKSLAGKREELRSAEDSLKNTQRDISAAVFNIGRLEKERRYLSERLKLRLTAMYKMRGGASSDVIFSAFPAAAFDSADLGRREKYMAIIMDSDASLIGRCEANLSRLKEQRQRLAGLKNELEAARVSAEARKNEEESLQKEKTALLADVKQEKERSMKVVKELEAAAAELSELVRKLRVEQESAPSDAKGFAAMRGRLPMPVEGTVVSFYGKVKHPKFQTVTFNNGVLIEAPAGRLVKSVYDGKVIYTGWLKGYGQIMIIDNGGGFYTLYAHLQKTLKDRGENVRKGAEIGVVGDTGMQERAGLYFEIREKGIPRDPMAWFASR